MSRRKTHKEFVDELNVINNSILVMGTYISANLPIECKCKICGHIWSATPHSLLYNHGCPRCFRIKRANSDRKSYEQFISEVRVIHPNVQVSGKYINNESEMDCKCTICKYEWKTTPHRLLRGYGCHRCGGVERKTTEKFIEELKSINENIEVLGAYKNSNTKIKCKCLKCGNVWMANPSDLLHKKSGCPVCVESKGERKISTFLNTHCIKHFRNISFNDLTGVNNGKLSYDFYLPDYNIIIEYQGEYHDGTIKNSNRNSANIEIQQEHDKLKKIYAEQNGYVFLEIWYKDFDNIENILKQKLNL